LSKIVANSGIPNLLGETEPGEVVALSFINNVHLKRGDWAMKIKYMMTDFNHSIEA